MDATKTNVLHEYKHASPLISCRYDPTGKYVFIGSEDFKVWRITVADGSETVLDVNAWVRGIAFADKGKTVITGGYDGRLIWAPVEGKTLKPTRTIEAHDGWIRAVAVSPDQKLIASVGNDLKVKLWSAADGKLVREMSGHESHIYNVAFHPDGKHLVTGDLKSNLIDWDVATGKQVRTWQIESLTNYDKKFLAFIGGFRSMTFNKDGSQLICAGITNVSNAFAGVGNPSVPVFDWKKGELILEHLSKGKLRGTAWGVAIHPNGSIIACVGGSGGHLLFWKADGAEEFFTMKLKNDARDLSLSPDGLHLATAHHDGNLRIHLMDAAPAGKKTKTSG